MRQSILILLLFLFCANAFCQPKIPVIKNGQDDNRVPYIRLTQSIINNSEVVIIYRGFSFFSQHSPLHIINYGVDKKWHYHEIATTANDSALRTINLPQDSIIKIWHAFVDNDLFIIKDEKELNESCPTHVNDGAWIDINIIAKTAAKGLHYYAAAVIEEDCPGSKERQSIIKCLDVIFSFDYEKYK